MPGVKKKKTANGDWLLSAFYPAFREDLGKRDVAAQKRRWNQIKEWVAARPQSSVALTALLRKTIDVAWAYRGSSYKVAKADRTPHQDWMVTVRQIAEQLVDRTDLESEMLYQLATLRTSIVPRDDGDVLSGIALAVRAAELGPDYHHGFLGAVRMTMPRWGGSAVFCRDTESADTSILHATEKAKNVPAREPQLMPSTWGADLAKSI